MLKLDILVQLVIAVIPVMLDKYIDASMNKKVDAVAQQVLEKQLPSSEMKDNTNKQEKQNNEDTDKKSRTTAQIKFLIKEENSLIRKPFYISDISKKEVYFSSSQSDIS